MQANRKKVMKSDTLADRGEAEKRDRQWNKDSLNK